MRTFDEVMAEKEYQHWQDIHHPCTIAGRKWREEGYRLSQELHFEEPSLESFIGRVESLERKSPPGRKEIDYLKGNINFTKNKLFEHIEMSIKKKEEYTIEEGKG